MNLQDLMLLSDVLRHGSFAGVARARGTDASSVSRAVAGVEAALGIRLFQRTTRRLALTEEGERYLARALPLAEELQRAGAEARVLRGAVEGVLRLTASVTFGQAMILPLLPAFRARYPDLVLECQFTDATLDLVAERIDLAIRLAPAIEGDLIASRLMVTRYRVVASPAYLSAAPPLDAPGALDGHRLLLFPFRPFRDRWLFRGGEGGLTEVPVRGDMILSPAGAILDAALAGMGVALLPNYLTDPHILAGRLTRCLPEWEVTATSFDTGAWAVYPSRAYLPARTRAMIDFLRAALPGQPTIG